MESGQHQRAARGSPYHSISTDRARSALGHDNIESKSAFCRPQGEVHSAISLITEHGKGEVLELTPEVRAALRKKHPQAKPANPDVLLQGEVPAFNSILFESLTGDVVRKTVLVTQGAAGPSIGDAYVWRRMMTSFKLASVDLCDAVAGVA